MWTWGETQKMELGELLTLLLRRMGFVEVMLFERLG